MYSYYFFRCVHCGEWYYTSRRIKRKKCWKCNRTFNFDNSSKFIKKCSLNDAIAIIKVLKLKSEKEDILKYFNNNHTSKK
ncbi:MAG: DUF1922 domain-containing protein [Candidatus Lokiarchaeota archaeon]|nr:DUF1922 domain-containing protein [Candidatus Lokiarchaeota archaeon]